MYIREYSLGTDMNFPFTAKQVTATIDRVDGRGLRSAIQTACLDIIGHAMEHGHSPLAGRLDDRMTLSPMMKRHAPAVQKFLTGYGPFNHSKDTGFVFSKAKRDALNEDKYEFEAYTLGLPFWDEATKAEKKTETFDVFKEVEKLIARAAKKEAEGHCIDSAMIEYLKALCGQYAGRKAISAAQEASKAPVQADPAPATSGALVDELRDLWDAKDAADAAKGLAPIGTVDRMLQSAVM